jgi:ABC-type polysaccharide/polyol phosphate transport system ATPase subunit/N-acetylglutamate synthase-like GNAT family acetyltransferase
MSSDNAITIQNVAKTYLLYDRPQDRLKQMLFRGRRQYYREYQALKSLSFELPKGEVLGVVGRNGAGKSTLLQLICGTLTPSTGTVQVNGRIAALLELGAGFNPQFTGRENIYLSASIMGVNREEVDQKIEDIIDFSGVRNFIDQPVSTYSSGMYVRLAFSVATSVEPDILIVDEALSVGDGDFARRSFERIMAMKEKGATILFCSHSLYQIEVLCSKAIWLEKGRLVKTGEPNDIVSEYQAFLDLLSNHPEAVPEDAFKKQAISPIEEQPPVAPQGEYARLTSIYASTETEAGELLTIQSQQTDLTLEINFVSTLKTETPQLAIVIHDAARKLITSSAAWSSDIIPTVNEEGKGQARITLPKLPLLKGTYYVGVLLFDQRGIFLHDEADPVVTLDVKQQGPERGVVIVPHTWEVTTPKPRLTADAKVTKRQPTDRWQTRPAQENDFEALKQVFENAFKHPIDDALWAWKYRHTSVPSFVVEEDNNIVAYCGGLSRQGFAQGQHATFCQLVDVMVHSKQRGVLTKTGPFFRCVAPFMTDVIGADKPCQFLFGFPNNRHLRAGARQSLYAPVDHILEASWPAAEQSDFTLHHWTGDPIEGAHIDQHWQAMLANLPDKLIGTRDQTWLRQRYLEHPHGGYHVYFVQSGQQTLGIIVLKDRPDSDQVELMDIICEPQHAQAMIQTAQQHAHSLNRSNVFAWLTPSVFAWLKETGAERQDTDIVIPGNGMDNLDHINQAKDNWWLMGGDSDFR